MTVLARPLPQRSTARRAPAAANATLVARRDLTDSLAVFVLRLDIRPAAFSPGQYVSLGVRRATGDGWIQRPYSVVSLSSGGTGLELLIRHIPGGLLSTVLWTLGVGSRMFVGPPRGLFTLDSDDRRRLFIASGTGVAPFVAMLDHLAALSDRVPTVLVHGVSHCDEFAFAARIHGWIEAGAALDYRPTVSRPDDPCNDGWRGGRGRAEAEVAGLATEGLLDPRSTLAYVCGNPAMIDACARILTNAGLRTADIRIERFHRPE